MAAQVKAELGFDVEMIEGAKGILDVKADGALVFSKHALGRWPHDGELVELLQARA